jgi:D-serine deaminase-like pyridoxal phosphate-dependent protein
VLDLDTVRANIDRAAAQARTAGVALRPHTKTHKLPQIARLQLEAGAVGVQVAKLGEAEVMADAGIDDILVGYPLVGERKLERLADLAGRASVSVTVDSEEIAVGVARVARARGLTLPVLLELDTGMHRLGALPGPEAADLAERVAALDGIELVGVFTHEGHVYTQARDAAEQKRMTLEACAAAVETAEEIRSRGVAADVVSVGSAATFRFAIRCPGVTEVRPGTYVFNDRISPKMS